MPEQQIDVAAQLHTLTKLQAIDSQIYKLKAEKKEKPLELERFDAEFQAKSRQVKNAEDKFTALQLKKKEKEITLQAKEENIKKTQIQLYQLKTNKEYSAMQKEIEGRKADKSAIEDEILLLMERIDEAKTNIAKEKEKLKDEKIKLDEQKKQYKAELQEIEKKLQSLTDSRKILLPQIAADVLKKYERILAGKNGLAVVRVINNCCQGCNMDLPAQIINEIRLKKNFIICENCTRFLYINDDDNA